ncbi:hypothetical protein HHI36_023535 [Cryptolaemus montrouzieri]|uniref:Uncharacterized protein n=1 Tax=Cryptolaemus montrouzieri TaxID=559131 RepID=A0ABD2PGV3_9CUCU
MLSRNFVFLCSFSILARVTDAAPAPAIPKSRQYIEPLPGYIPVYIRPGDTPLEDINLDLAEAFDSYAQKHGRFNFGRSTKEENIDNIDNFDDKPEKEKNNDGVDISDVKLQEESNNEIIPDQIHKETVINLNDLSLDVPVAIGIPDLPEPTYIHIQKIPRKPST